MTTGIIIIVIVALALKILNVKYNKAIAKQQEQPELNLLPETISYEKYLEIHNNQIRSTI